MWKSWRRRRNGKLLHNRKTCTFILQNKPKNSYLFLVLRFHGKHRMEDEFIYTRKYLSQVRISYENLFQILIIVISKGKLSCDGNIKKIH